MPHVKRPLLVTAVACALPSLAHASEPASPSASTPPPAFTLKGAPGSGVTLDLGKAFSVNVKTRMQLRYSLQVAPADEEGARDLNQRVGVQTARLWVSGHAFRPELTYLTQLAFGARDFRDGTTTPLFDAYLDWKAHRDLNVRAGQYFVPFDRLRTTVESALLLVERARPVNELTLDRDVGITVYSNNFLHDKSPLAWRVGVFGGGGANLTADKKAGALVVGRVELRPLGPVDDQFEGDLAYHKKPGLMVGGGVGANFNTNRSNSTTGSRFVGGTTDYLHLATDLVFKWRGFSLAAEYVWRRASVDRINSTDRDGQTVTEYTRSGQGWVAQIAYDSPMKLGAVARLGRTSALAGTDPKFVEESAKSGQEYAVGVNYFLNGHAFKWQADWLVRTSPSFEARIAEHIPHVQLDATF